MLRRVFILLVAVIGFCGSQAAFEHEVIPSCKPTDEVCSFSLVVEQKETMVWYNKSSDKGFPVLPGIPTPGKYSKRVDCSENGTKGMNKDEINDANTADGYFRLAYFINDQFPGPNIVVYEGQQVVVRVSNKLLQESISIHWHGMIQRDTPWMDGVAGVTQCAIDPEQTFTYRFIAEPTGTHWYHSHVGGQRADGLYGALIVLPKEKQTSQGAPNGLAYAKDYIMFVQDWFHLGVEEINSMVYAELQQYWDGFSDLSQCHDRDSEMGAVPFETGLINGKGYFYPNKTATRAVQVPLENFTVKHTAYYRFRLINPSMNFAFLVSIDNHPLHVISSDGNDILQTKADDIVVHPGERYDFYIRTNETVDNYYIRASTIERIAGIPQSREPGKTLAILHYIGAGDKAPISRAKNCTDINPCVYLNCPYRQYPDSYNIECHNVDTINSTGKYDISGGTIENHFLNFHFPATEGGALRSSINDKQFILPDFPPQVTKTAKYSETCDKDICDKRHCSCTHQINVTFNNMIQMVLTSTVPPKKYKVGIPATAHPVHLHGHHFYVLKVGYPTIDNKTKSYVGHNPDLDCNVPRNASCKWTDSTWKGDNIPGLNLVNPPLKDTVIVPVGGYVVIRFKADNPGWWMLHCHVALHQVEGMALIMQEGEPYQMNPVPDQFPSCGSFNWSSDDFKKKLEWDPNHPKEEGKAPDIHFILFLVSVSVLGLTVLILVIYCCWTKKRRGGYQEIQND